MRYDDLRDVPEYDPDDWMYDADDVYDPRVSDREDEGDSVLDSCCPQNKGAV